MEPIIKGGQGRSAEDVQESGWIMLSVFISALILIGILALPFLLGGCAVCPHTNEEKIRKIIQ